MPSLLSPRPIALSGIAVALMVAATLLPAAGASAAPAKPVISCPQAVGVVGFPIDSQPLATVGTGESVTVSITGILPAGVVQHDVPAYLYGSPSAMGSSLFTVSATAHAADGSTSSDAKSCSMVIKAAPTVTRIAGADRYEQSAKVSKDTFDASAVAYLASGEKYADALSAAAIAAVHEAPLLLTPAGALAGSVIAELQRLGVTEIAIVGGAASVSPAVESQLARVVPGATVTRIGGADRYEVSRNLITDAHFGAMTPTHAVYLATGANFPDALTVTPAAALSAAPVLLINGAEAALTTAEKTVLNRLGATDVFIAGGPNSVSAALEADLKTHSTVTRYGGRDRFEVSGAVNSDSFFDAERIYLASGALFPDALSGGVSAGIRQAPLYITEQNCVRGEAIHAIGRLAPTSVVILGGTATLGAAVDSLTSCPLD